MEKDTIRFMVQCIDRSSASVESVAIDVCISTDNNITITLYNPQWDCIDLLYGNIFPDKDSEKKTRCGGRIYSSDCLGEYTYLIFCDGLGFQIPFSIVESGTRCHNIVYKKIEVTLGIS